MNESDRMELRPYDRWPAKRGQGNNELLVLMLIVTILSLLMMPAFNPYIVKAKYAAEAIPAVGSLRTHIDLFRLESDRLPGLGHPSEGVPGGTSQLAPGLSKLQTVAGTNAAFASDFSRKVDVASANHVLPQVDISQADLTREHLRPQHIQYRVDAATSNRHLYATGVFGDGQGLKAGTGYAVLEFSGDDKAQTKKIAVWQRYKPAQRKSKQVVMVNAEEARRHFGCDEGRQAQEMDICWIGDTVSLLSSDAGIRERAVAELRAAGWEMSGEPPIPWHRKQWNWWNIPPLLIYTLVLVGLGWAAFGQRRLSWRWGLGLVGWLAILVGSLPLSPLGPVVCVYGGGLALCLGLWLWNRLARGIRWVGRRFQRKRLT